MSRAGVEPDSDEQPPLCEERIVFSSNIETPSKKWVAAINIFRCQEYELRSAPDGSDRGDRRFRALTAKAMYYNHIDQHGCEL